MQSNLMIRLLIMPKERLVPMNWRMTLATTRPRLLVAQLVAERLEQLRALRSDLQALLREA